MRRRRRRHPRPPNACFQQHSSSQQSVGYLRRSSTINRTLLTLSHFESFSPHIAPAAIIEQYCCLPRQAALTDRARFRGTHRRCCRADQTAEPLDRSVRSRCPERESVAAEGLRSVYERRDPRVRRRSAVSADRASECRLLPQAQNLANRASTLSTRRASPPKNLTLLKRESLCSEV